MSHFHHLIINAQSLAPNDVTMAGLVVQDILSSFWTVGGSEDMVAILI